MENLIKYYAHSHSSGIDFKAKNMKEAVKEAALHFVTNYQGKLDSKCNHVLEFTVGLGKLAKNW